MPAIQTIVFEAIDQDVQSNKQLCIHPIHRCVVSGPFPVTFDFAVLTSAYDLPPGQYVCKHTLIAEGAKREILALTHKPAPLDRAGGIGFRSSFENIVIEKPGRYIVRTEVGKFKGEDVSIRFEVAPERASRSMPLGVR